MRLQHQNLRCPTLAGGLIGATPSAGGHRMNLHSVHTDLLQGVKSDLNYRAPTRERPRTYTYDPPVGVARTTVVNDPRQVVISDARPLLSQVSLDEEGFALVRHKSATRDFYDDVEVKRVYYPEAEQLLKGIT